MNNKEKQIRKMSILKSFGSNKKLNRGAQDLYKLLSKCRIMVDHKIYNKMHNNVNLYKGKKHFSPKEIELQWCIYNDQAFLQLTNC